MKYTFSFYVKEDMSKLVTPPWWKFWEKPYFEENVVWSYRQFPMSEEQGNTFLNWNADPIRHRVERELFLLALTCGGGDIHSMQLEDSNCFGENYIATEAEPCRTAHPITK